MTRPAPVVAGTLAVLVLLLGAYMGAYYANLKRASFNYDVDVNDGVLVLKYVPAYRLEHRTIHWLLWPANQLDRQLRPGYWKDEVGR